MIRVKHFSQIYPILYPITILRRRCCQGRAPLGGAYPWQHLLRNYAAAWWWGTVFALPPCWTLSVCSVLLHFTCISLDCNWLEALGHLLVSPYVSPPSIRWLCFTPA